MSKFYRKFLAIISALPEARNFRGSSKFSEFIHTEIKANRTEPNRIQTFGMIRKNSGNEKFRGKFGAHGLTLSAFQPGARQRWPATNAAVNAPNAPAPEKPNALDPNTPTSPPQNKNTKRSVERSFCERKTEPLPTPVDKPTRSMGKKGKIFSLDLLHGADEEDTRKWIQ